VLKVVSLCIYNYSSIKRFTFVAEMCPYVELQQLSITWQMHPSVKTITSKQKVEVRAGTLVKPKEHLSRRLTMCQTMEVS